MSKSTSKHRRTTAHIPARREFIAKPHSVFRLLSPLFCLLSSTQAPSPAHLATHSRVNYAKQTQFSKRQNYRNILCYTDLQQYPAPPHAQKTNPNKANPPTQYAIRNTQYAARNTTNKPNQTQFNPRNTLHAACYMPSAIRESSIQHQESAGGLHYLRKMV